jgi:hypothetical protein
MAETTSNRFGLVVWGAGTDGPSRVEFNANFGALETLAAIDRQGVFGSRPAAGKQGTYYKDTTNGYLWRDNGSAWETVGSRAQDAQFNASAVGAVPLVSNGASGQTADLLQLKVNGVTRFYVDKDGNYNANVGAAKRVVYTNDTAGSVVIDGKGAASQSADLLRLRDNANADMFRVTPTGAVTSSFLKTAAGGSVIGASSGSNVANMNYWAGTPSFEVRGASGTGAFDDFLYLAHPDAPAATAVERQLGVLMKWGGEGVGNGAKSASVYLYSAEASGTNPKLKIDVRDLNVWEMDPTNGSVTNRILQVNNYIHANPSIGAAVRVNDTYIGTQSNGDHLYLRSASTSHGFYWYAGGSHSSTAGDAGGGNTLASLLPFGTTGMLSTGRLELGDTGDAEINSAAHPLQIGPSNSFNMRIDANEILAVNNGDFDTLFLQQGGGLLQLGNYDTAVGITGHRFAVGFTAPANPPTNTIWLDAAFGTGGLKKWNGSSWQKLP